MLKLKKTSSLLLFLGFIGISIAMEGMDDTSEYARPNITNGGSKTFHWLSSMFFLLILSSISTTLAFADKLHSAFILQIVSLFYAVVEALFLSFPDGNGVENRTSTGTAWFLLILSGITVFFATLNSGSNFLIASNENRFGLKWIAKLGENSLKNIHKTLSFILTLTGWCKVALAPVSLFGFCRDDHLGQCIAHGVMGSFFILYGFVYAMVLVLSRFRDSSNNHQQDWYDSLIMTVWGVVNTFTEHRWGEDWSNKDFQHTSMGIIWWGGGLLGLWFTRNGGRSWIPAMLLMFTGWSMSEHAQELIISTKIHFIFGLSLMIGGLCRIIEMSFLLRDERNAGSGKILSFQYLSSFFLIEAGVLFMGANEEQLELVLSFGSDHVAYTLTLTTASFLILLWFLLLLELYEKLRDGISLKGAQNNSSKYEHVSSNENEYSPSTEFELDNFEE
ncbi:hypothetical protein WICMUC_000048 [Wickerhamomyces mucosus]|uniref:Protein YTP1-like C-terminal domain-containing protein n=1 Tax=Wickerhamomyces mucosus TaxID=1378264 RepID=A0A9P8Q0D5_9ASCO|nr:hypothetical protein WICMUC_000048 [Wickerhamomyces mucosus]